MEQIEVSSFATLDALKKRAKIVEKIGSIESGLGLSVFCKIEDDLLELYYNDVDSSYIRRYKNEKEFREAIKKRREELGEEEEIIEEEELEEEEEEFEEEEEGEEEEFEEDFDEEEEY
jgi:hypothetical protein